jgi:hypothetical protein
MRRQGPLLDDRGPLVLGDRGQLAGPAMAAMIEYRIYKIDGDGTVVGPILRVQRESDEAVIATARGMDGAQAFDIWDGSRRVATVPAHGGPADDGPIYF